MAVDTNSIAYLIDPFWQGEGINGKPLVAGYMCVYIAGTDQKYITWQDWDGTRHPFKIPLGSDGRATILAEVQYTYDCYLYDSFGNLVCSRLNVKPAIGGDVSVSGLTQVFHDETISGNGTPQEPIGVVSAGKVYEGIEPIVVNNDLDKISANHVPLGVQDPLYFVQDDEEACIIGFSGQTIPEGVMSESALGFENDKITGYNGSAFSAGNEYEAGNYISIDNNTINVVNLPTSADVQNIVDVATSGLMPSGDYLTKESADTLYAPTGNYLTGLPDDLVYTADITGFATTAELDNKLDKADSANFLLTSDSAKFYPMDSNPSGYIYELPDDLATTGWVDSQGYITDVDIPESATWNATTETVSSNSAQWGASNPQIPVTGINGIKISESGDQVVFEVSANYATEDWVTGQGYLTAETDWTNTITAASANAYNEATAAIPTGLATTGDLQTVSGEITALIPSTAGLATEDFVTSQGYITNDAITGKQDITGMTAYATVESLTAKQDAGDYLSATDSANFLLTSDSGNFYPSDNPSAFITGVDLTPYQTTAGMTAYLTTGDSAEFMTTAERSDYIPTGVSSEFYTTANTANYISEVPDTYLQNTDLSTEEGKVTAISGIPLSAGGDVPEGVMVESGLEYDNTEISGYSGSAFKDVALTDVVTANSGAWGGSALPISAGPGVKFEMVDNTLVASTDETVLASSIANEATAFTLSEEAGNFERLRLYDTYGNIVEVAADNSRLTWVFDRTNSNGTRMNRCYTITSTDGINWNELNVYGWNQTAYTGELSLNGGIDWYLETHKIVGINRIAGE